MHCVAGFDGTSNVLAGKLFGVPVSGTHAHSFVSSFQSTAELSTRVSCLGDKQLLSVVHVFVFGAKISCNDLISKFFLCPPSLLSKSRIYRNGCKMEI